MKTKIIILIFVFIGIIVGLLYAVPSAQAPRPRLVGSVASTPPSVPTPVIAEPQTLIIPKLNIKADVEAVGEDNLGKMDVPKKVEDVGWYSLGFKPGEQGSAVIDGHLDTVTGAPAVFYYISQLSPGDQVIVTDKNNQAWIFIVTESQSYPFDQVPLKQVFDTEDKPRLNLITCVGIWNTGTRNYSNRLVVYTELKQ